MGGGEVSRVVLRYADEFPCPPGTFQLLKDGVTLRCCIREAESPRHVVEFQVRFRKPNPGALHLRPLDSETTAWLVESSVLHRDLARMELQLTEVPAFCAWAFLQL
jgi:hypothetical protein